MPENTGRDRRHFILLTCEHAGRLVPPPYRHLFEGHMAVLDTHRAYDPGALEVALKLASAIAAPIQFIETTRLLVDANRSADNGQVFSEFTDSLDPAEKQNLLARYYWPHRNGVEQLIASMICSGRSVLHIALHSFVDSLNGQVRDFDLGLLFDPARGPEADIARCWLGALRTDADPLNAVSNRPYLGTDDGLTTAMRLRFAPDSYSGLEVEMRQGMLGSASSRERVAGLLARSLAVVASSTMPLKRDPGGMGEDVLIKPDR